MRKFVFLFAFASASTAMASDAGRQLKDECQRVYKVYPLLMVASMLESPMECGDVASGESIDCDESLSDAEKAAKAERLKGRQTQEAGYKAAEEACMAWDKNKKSAEFAEAAKSAIGRARALDKMPLPASEKPN
jgi:hypothetical protein